MRNRRRKQLFTRKRLTDSHNEELEWYKEKHNEELEWYKKEISWYKGENKGLQDSIAGVVGWYKGKLDRQQSDAEKRANTAFEVVQEAERDLAVQTDDLIKLRATPGVAAALAAAEMDTRGMMAGAATEKAASNAFNAYIHAAKDWPRPGYALGNVRPALQAAAAAASAAAAFQRAAQAEAAGQRATERFARLEGDPPYPDSNERIAKEWSVAVRVANIAHHEAETRHAAACVRHEDAKQASVRVGAAWAARLAKEASERVDNWKASGAPMRLIGPEHEHVSSGSEDSEPEHEAAADDSDSEDRPVPVPAPELPVPVPVPVANPAAQKRVAGKNPAGTRCHKKKRSE